jgi:hypothetical protein
MGLLPLLGVSSVFPQKENEKIKRSMPGKAALDLYLKNLECFTLLGFHHQLTKTEDPVNGYVEFKPTHCNAKFTVKCTPGSTCLLD